MKPLSFREFQFVNGRLCLIGSTLNMKTARHGANFLKWLTMLKSFLAMLRDLVLQRLSFERLFIAFLRLDDGE